MILEILVIIETVIIFVLFAVIRVIVSEHITMKQETLDLVDKALKELGDPE